jgi:tetratricopeptide (TPR) repeat protein/predicted Ser/Thr protein kinase
LAKETLSHYEIQKELGSGGMATVYEAKDLESNKSVALKVLFPHLASEEVTRKRFLREAHTGMELDHPGIVKVYEVGEDEDQSFIAMELVEGQTLDAVIDEESLDIDRVIDVCLKISEALSAAHEMGIVHRDIKPRNIMLSNGHVKLMDFGLAQIVEGTILTGKYEIIGTLNYMSPQQAIGASVDERSDIFSLGVVFYQMLTGELPFEGDHPGAVIHAILHSDPLRVEELREGVPEEVERVVFKALQKEPQARYSNAIELNTDLKCVSEVLEGRSCKLIATEEVFEERVGGVYSELVGRESEVEVLEGYLERMLKGDGSTVMVAGEAGIGKSRLVWELGRRAKKEKARYLVGRCLSGGEGFPYQPVFEVIRSYLGLKGVRDLEKLEDFINEKAPTLMGRLGVIQAFLFMEKEEELQLTNREQLWDTVAELVKMMSRDKPVLLHFDDLHWTDLPTLNLINYLSRNVRGERVLVVGTYRPEDLIEEVEGKPHPLVTTLEKMGREGLYEEVNLCRLDEERIGSMVGSVFPDSDFPEDFINSLHVETEGNPLFILELLQLIRDEGVIAQVNGGWSLVGDISTISIPGRVNDVIMNRLRSLSMEERNLIDAASVEGRSFQSDTLCHCLGLQRIQVLLILQNLEQTYHIIHASEKEYNFDHGMIREVVYESLIPELRGEYHRLIGGYFRESFGEKEEYAGKIAFHMIEAKEEREVLPYLVKAGEHARRLFATEEAIGYFDKGMEVIDEYYRPDPTPENQRLELALLKGRAGVNQMIGRYDEANQDYKTLEELAGELADEGLKALGKHGLGETARNKGDYDAALGYFEQSIVIRKEIGDKRGEGSSLSNIGIVYRVRGDVEKALDCYKRALEIYRNIGDKLGERVVLNNIGNIYGRRGDYEEALSYYEKSLAIGEQIGDKRGEGFALNNLGNVQTRLSNYKESLAFYERSLGIRRQVGDKRGEGAALNNIGGNYFKLGDYELALNCFEQALVIWRQIGAKEYQWESQNALFHLWLALGATDKAFEEYDEVVELAGILGTGKKNAWMLLGTGLLKMVSGSYEDAAKHIQSSLEMARAQGEVDVILDGLVAAARLEIARNEISAARKYVEEELDLARDKNRKREIAQANLFLSRICLVEKELEEAESRSRKAIDISRNCDIKPMLWEAHHSLGKVLLKQTKHAAAKKEMEKARQIVDEIASKLGAELKKIYLARAEIKNLEEDLKGI